jgi:predicted glycosyltransferase
MTYWGRLNFYSENTRFKKAIGYLPIAFFCTEHACSKNTLTVKFACEIIFMDVGDYFYLTKQTVGFYF